MQKFKVSKEEFRKALKDISDWSFVSIELEGEPIVTVRDVFSDLRPLEGGGTVENCCFGCLNGALINEPWCGNKMCNCHNKKEERPLCNWKGCQLTTEKKGIGSHNYRTLCNGHRGKRFNRETPKECCCRGRIKAPASHSLNRCAAISKKEVKLPEKIDLYNKSTVAEVKINQILTYLASKES